MPCNRDYGHARWLRLALLAVLLASCSPAQAPPPRPPPAAAPPDLTRPAEALPGQGRIRARIRLPPGARSVAFGNQAIWVSHPAPSTISLIDVATSEVVGAPIPLDFEPREIAYGEGALWVCDADRTRLARIDPRTNRVAAVIDLRALQIPATNYLLLAAGEGAVWVAYQTAVIQIDPQTNQIVGQPIPAGEEIIALALGHGTLWTGSHDDGIVTRIDSKTNRVVATIDMGFSVHGLAAGGESAWVLDEHGFAVVRIDPGTNQLRERIPIDAVGANLAADATSVWVAPAARDNGRATGNDGIARISAEKKRVQETIHVGDAATSQYYSVFFSEGWLWAVIDTPEITVVQIAP